MRLLERVVFAPDVLVEALAVPGSTSARALDRVVDGGAELAISRTVVLTALARLVELLDHDAEALGRTAVLLGDLGRDFGVGGAAPARDGETLSAHLGLLCAVSAADALVAYPDAPNLASLRTGGARRATGSRRPARFPLHGTRLLSPREFARRAVTGERRLPELLPRLDRLEAIARSLHPTTVTESLPYPCGPDP